MAEVIKWIPKCNHFYNNKMQNIKSFQFLPSTPSGVLYGNIAKKHPIQIKISKNMKTAKFKQIFPSQYLPLYNISL